MNQMNLGREKLPDWNEEIWSRIDQAVHDECKRIEIASQFLPMQGPKPEALTVHTDTIETARTDGALSVDEGNTTRMNEIWTEFTLTPPQYLKEGELMTAVTLATRCANILSQAMDLLIFQGETALNDPLFTGKRVKIRANSNGGGIKGLLNVPFAADHIIEVPPLVPNTRKYGENTFAAVAKGYSVLQDKGHYGPYVLVLDPETYADTYAPLPTTLIMPADRIKPLVPAGFYGTGTLPPLTGLLLSLGGNSMDHVVGYSAITGFMQQDVEDQYRFRVSRRFTFRGKDQSAWIKYVFI